MYRIHTAVDFCYGHRLLGYEGPCQHLHGHNARAEVILRGDTLDHRNFLYDFSELKDCLSEWVHKNFDHRMLLNKSDPVVLALRELGEPVVLFDTNPTAEAIAKKIHDFFVEKNLPVEEVKVWENQKAWVSYGENS